MKTYDVGDLVRIDAIFLDLSVVAEADGASDAFTAAGHSFTDNDPVLLRGHLLPAPLAADQTYYVVAATSDTFKVSLTQGGAAVNLTGNGRARVSKLLDPTNVTALYRKPDGTVVTKEFGTDPEIDQDAQGRYHMDVSVDAAGTWIYRWVSTGAGQAAEERSFFVRRQGAA